MKYTYTCTFCVEILKDITVTIDRPLTEDEAWSIAEKRYNRWANTKSGKSLNLGDPSHYVINCEVTE